MESIVGMEDGDALALIDELMRHATQQKNEYRHRWRLGDWVLWDHAPGQPGLRHERAPPALPPDA
jgi:hypothetical protein